MCRELSGSYRPVAALAFRLSSRWLLMWLLFTGSYLMNVYSVFKVLVLSLCCNNSVVTSHILEKKKPFAVGPAGLLYRPRGPTFTDSEQSVTAVR